MLCLDNWVCCDWTVEYVVFGLISWRPCCWSVECAVFGLVECVVFGQLSMLWLDSRVCCMLCLDSWVCCMLCFDSWVCCMLCLDSWVCCVWQALVASLQGENEVAAMQEGLVTSLWEQHCEVVWRFGGGESWHVHDACILMFKSVAYIFALAYPNYVCIWWHHCKVVWRSGWGESVHVHDACILMFKSVAFVFAMALLHRGLHSIAVSMIGAYWCFADTNVCRHWCLQALKCAGTCVCRHWCLQALMFAGTCVGVCRKSIYSWQTSPTWGWTREMYQTHQRVCGLFGRSEGVWRKP